MVYVCLCACRASPGGHSAGAGLTREQSVRLASDASSDSNNLAVQVQLAGGPLSQATAVPGGQATAVPGGHDEVSLGGSRSSGRQCIKRSFYQAGCAGLKSVSSN